MDSLLGTAMHPTPPPADPDPAFERRLAKRLARARAVLAVEQAWPLLVPPLALAATFVALALFDVLPLLPGWLHGLVLAAYGGGLGFLLMRVPLRLRRPALDEAARRLERDSELANRPLEALADRPAGGADDPVTAALWAAHRRRMAALAGRLRLAWPDGGMAARDPYGWRAAALLLLVIALAGGWHDGENRLTRALSPQLGVGAPASLEVWINPPATANAPPVLLAAGGEGIDVPAGSTVLAVLSGGWGGATLVLDDERIAFERQDGDGQRIEAGIGPIHRLAVRQTGRTLAEWPIRVVADALPSIDFAAPPETGDKGRLRLDLAASDDHGLERAWIEIRRLGAPDGEAPAMVELQLPANRPRQAGLAGWHDLTAHPWAGLPATLAPKAADTMGQTGGGVPVTITLPERHFTHPAAQALAAQRRAVTEDRANAPRAADVIDGIVDQPELFNDDLAVFLALMTAHRTLMGGDFDLAEVQDLLWNAALRIEDGELAGAERTLEQARRALERALAGDASAAEIEQLVEQFRAAMERYVAALAARAADNPAAMAPNQRAIGSDELADMADTLRALAEAGARDALKQMLDRLGALLDGLQAAPADGGGPAVDAARGLRDLAERQQRMLDTSHRNARAGARGAAAEAARAQQALRHTLDGLADKLAAGLGRLPDSLGEAAGAMDEAARSLGEGDWGTASEAQAAAVAALGQATREAMAELSAAGQGGFGAVPRDPLGRPLTGTGFGDDGTTRIPERGDLVRAREILDELRRRAGEWRRPEAERDYLRRLLKQF
ncbi:DUF4175 domain-containing protein [Magnetospirillum sp. UT-4]|uniref:DUF4175 domain-containing protein n=1 Tax=Magnetospirillum sp. UT-4 TaxID=2681467 RepID=UPI00137E57EE|nr:DUF4175 family protein [Magnetospirillum sp. UT-4]CAA7624536.1 conserved membrane hypothetical protein [Magnetospirillum sp. UT-4]